MSKTKIISISNQKGGVGKTTTTLNLGTALSLIGKKVLLIDFDPQANLSSYLGFDDKLHEEKETEQLNTINDLMMCIVNCVPVNNEVFNSCIYHSEKNDLDYIPADLNLSNTDLYLMSALSRETVLKRILSFDNIKQYDYVLIDCPPNLGILQTNALTASNGIIIPVQTQKFALNGLTALEDVTKQIKDTINPSLQLIGVLATIVDNTTNISRRNVEILKERYIDNMFETVIHRSVEAAYSAESGRSLCLYKTKLGEEYKALAIEMDRRIADKENRRK